MDDSGTTGNSWDQDNQQQFCVSGGSQIPAALQDEAPYGLSICFLFAEGAALPEHGDQGEGEAGAGGDELGVPSRHPHHHPPLPHARGEGHEPAHRAAAWPDKNRAGRCDFTFSVAAEGPTPRTDIPRECWTLVQLRLLQTWNFDSENAGFLSSRLNDKFRCPWWACVLSLLHLWVGVSRVSLWDYPLDFLLCVGWVRTAPAAFPERHEGSDQGEVCQ